LIEMTRKRTRESLLHTQTEPCTACEGKGYTKSRRTVTYELLRELRRQGDLVEGDTVLVEVHPDVAQVLASTDRPFLEEMEKRLQKRIVVKARGSFHVEDFEIRSPNDKAPIEKSEVAAGGRDDKDGPRGRAGGPGQIDRRGGRGNRRLARRRPARPARVRRGCGARRPAFGRRRPVHGRRLRALRSRARDGSRKPRRSAAHGAGPGRARQGPPPAVVRRERASRRRRARSVLRRRARLRGGVRHLRARLPGAARSPAPRARRMTRDRGGGMDARLEASLGAALGARVLGARPLSGGDINDAFEVRLADGREVFVKSNVRAPNDMFV